MLHSSLPFQRIHVTGKDAATFLQGQFTIDVTTLLPGQTHLSAYCSAKGKVQTTFWITGQGNDFIIIVPQSTVKLQMELLKRYALFSKVSITLDASPVYGTRQPKNESSSICLANSTRCFSTEPSDDSLSPKDWAAADIEEGFVLLDLCLSDTLFPHYLNLVALGGIGFKKGCYLGQEIIARMEYRTEIKRHLCHATVIQEGAIALGDSILNEQGASIGVWVAGPCTNNGQTT
ncbi:MAG: hypothetical protein V4490_06655, partial [Pseudomonadota bacterium]